MSQIPDTAQNVAFSAAAPQAERTDALGELQKAHAPTSVRDLLLPNSEMREVVDYISGVWSEQNMLKAADPRIPFPSKFAREGRRGMQSVHLDNLRITAHGDYWEKPGMFGFEAMRQMVTHTPVLNAVIMTRIRQVQRFCRINESGEGPGFTIAHIDRGHELTEDEQQSIRLLNRFLMNCGWEFNPRARRRLMRDSFSQFMAKLTRDSLTLDSAPIETELARDRRFGIDGLYAVDGATIRLCTEDGYRGDDEIFALQVVQGRISAAYGHDDLIYEPRNPQSDVLSSGYGLGETELMIRVVTGFLNAMTYNIKGFDSNAIPRGVLHLTGNYDDRDLAAFKRYWNAMVRGVNNAWSLPVMVSKDQESRASFENFGVEFNEMYFAKWMTFLTSIICAIYGMSPAEINFDSFTAGHTSALSGSDTDEKIAASRDSGLWPLLSYFEGVLTDYVIADFSEKYVFRWTGIDGDDAEKREERSRLVMTVNEMRAQERLAPLEGDFGDAPINPSLTGVWMQLHQQNQPEDYGQPPEQGGQPGDEQDEGQDDQQPEDEGGGDESDDMAAARQQQEGEQQGRPEGQGGDEREAEFGKALDAGNLAAPLADADLRKANSHHDPKTGRFTSAGVSDAALREHREFLDGSPVAVLSGDEFKPDGTPLTKRVTQWYQDCGCETVDVAGIGPVLLDEKAVKNSLSHGIGRDKAAAFAAVPDVLRSGRVLHAEPMRGSRDGGMVHHVAAPVRIGDKEFVAIVLVKSDEHAKRMYVHEVILKERLQQSAFKTSADAAEAGVRAGADAGAIRSVLQRVYAVNPSEDHAPPGAEGVELRKAIGMPPVLRLTLPGEEA